MKRALLVMMLLTASCSQESAATTTSETSQTTSSTMTTESSNAPSTTAPTPLTTSTTTGTTTTSDMDGSTTTVQPEDDEPASTTSTTEPPSAGVPLIVAAYEPVLGVPIGTEFDVASADLEAILGPPDEDTGWAEGCPLDGPEENERSLVWGSLRVDFYLTGTGRMSAWVYDTTEGDDRPDRISQLQLPGDTTIGTPMSDVAATIGTELFLDGVFDAAITGEDGYSLWGFPASDEAPLTLIGVPYVPVCE